MTRARIVAESDASPPRVSVVIPALNSSRTIGRCIRALTEQATTHRFEVVVVHSGSDDTCAVASAVDPAVRAIQLPRRALAAEARNVGVRAARGEILAFVDSDAYADPAWIESVVSAAETGFDVICGSIDNANPHSAVSRAEQLLMFSEFFPETPERAIWFALAGNTVMRRAAYDRFGPFVEVRAAEDVLFSRRLVAGGGSILFYPRMRVFHDNRQTLRAYLRNQLLLGKYTAVARRTVAFADIPYALFLLCLPIAPLAKLAKILWRICRWTPRNVAALLREAPLCALGLAAYGVGQVRGAVARLESPEREGGLVRLGTEPRRGL